MSGSVVVLKSGSRISSLTEWPGDYEEWILAGMGVERSVGEVVPVAAGAPFPPVGQVAAVVITGSSAMVTERLPWVVAGEEWLRQLAGRSVPILGICFGHQWLAQALGGEVGYNPRGVEVGTVELRLTDAARNDPLFAGLPPRFPVQASHRQTVLRPPEDSVLLATSALDDCQAFRWGERAWGIQFHPEFAAGIMPRYIEHYRRRLLDEGKSPAGLQRGVAATPESAEILRRFARLAGQPA